MGQARIIAVLVALLSALAQAAVAQICNLEVYQSKSGELIDEVDESASFSAGDEYIICFSAGADGYVSLWDRLPVTSPVERLVPNSFQSQSQQRAIFVGKTDRHCFGTGDEGYFLHMDPADGLGTGVMWLLYQTDEGSHPDEASFDSAARFDQGYVRYGAGAKRAPRFEDAKSDEAHENADSCALNTKTLLYRYHVK